MKTYILILLFSSILAMSYSQTSVEKLKKDLTTVHSENQKLKDENSYLKEKLGFFTVLSSDTVTQVKSFSSLYSIKVISCKGDRNSQTITIDLLLEHKTTNQNFAINLKESKAVNSIGQEYSLNNPGLSTHFYSIFTNTPQRMTIVLENVLPGTDMLSLVALKMSTKDSNVNSYQFEYTEIRNLKIVW